METPMNRRSFLQNSGLIAAATSTGCMRHLTPAQSASAPTLPFYDAVAPIIPIRAHTDRIFRTTVCLRPFRAAGPRIEVERLGDKLVVHNYGHGGSGWSLSWGSADVAVRMALEASPGTRNIAVIGCGALGLTAATTAQRAGLHVAIYAKERPPYVRSARATGSWTPDSRIALTASAAPDFADKWEAMARTSFAMYQSYLGMPGNPIEWIDRYSLDDPPTSGITATPEESGNTHGFAHYNSRLADLVPRWQQLPTGTHPFGTMGTYRSSTLCFNVADYSRQLMNDFLIAGGQIETRDFETPQDLASLPQRLLINCTGYGARQLWSDETIVPVRGQIAWLIPQEGVHYGLQYRDLNILARRDGIVIQPTPGGDDYGWNDVNEQPNRAEAEAGVLQLQALYDHIAKQRA
jgi:D-amino-acid oxidase